MLQPRIVRLNLAKVRLQRFQVASQLGDAFQLARDAGVQDVEVGVDLCEPCIEFTTLAHEHQYRVDDDEQGQGEYGTEHDLGAEDDVEDEEVEEATDEVAEEPAVAEVESAEDESDSFSKPQVQSIDPEWAEVEEEATEDSEEADEDQSETPAIPTPDVCPVCGTEAAVGSSSCETCSFQFS